MRSVRFEIGIDFEDDNAGGMVLFRHGIQGEDTRLVADGGFDLLLGNGLVAVEPSGIDFDLSDAHIGALQLIGMDPGAHHGSQHECAEYKIPPGLHVSLTRNALPPVCVMDNSFSRHDLQHQRSTTSAMIGMNL